MHRGVSLPRGRIAAGLVLSTVLVLVGLHQNTYQQNEHSLGETVSPRGLGEVGVELTGVAWLSDRGLPLEERFLVTRLHCLHTGLHRVPTAVS